jgi:hypothetical protein
MFVINLDFYTYDDTSVTALLGAVGVYTVWSPQATDRPTYLGEGHITTRLPEHVNTWKRGITGAIAILANTGTAKAAAKFEGRIAEAFLLELGEVLGRKPAKNEHPGCTDQLREIIEIENKVRVNICGLNPFTHPSKPTSRLDGRVQAEVAFGDDGDFFFTSPWNRRPQKR